MTNRSPGIHVSDIIHDLSVHVYNHYIPSPLDINRMQLGNALEDAIVLRYAAHYPNQYFKGHEININNDNIFGTYDLTSLYNTQTAVDEIKLTWNSSKATPLDHTKHSRKMYWKWEAQLASYCLGMKTRVGYLHVYHVMGDYSHNYELVEMEVAGIRFVTVPGGPQYRVWRYEWTMEDLYRNWTLLKSHSETQGFLERLTAKKGTR